MTRVALSVPLLLLLAACVTPAAGPGTTAAAPGQRQQRDTLVEACRQEATRTVLYRDRGQQMRQDDREARIGVQGSSFSLRAESERLGQQFERDRLARECVRANTPDSAAGAPAAAPPGPTPARP
jgi:hypothetical protein